MIPLRLAFSGIYSYQSPQEIDFSRLTEAQLFGIFGPVGSGKSSILEAVSFALYGRTERLNQQDKIGYNMMNLKSNQIQIQFDFRAGSGAGELYRFEVRAKRHRSQFDQVRSFERRQFRKVGEEWQPESLRAEDVLGLSYENFRRTIIIHQGKFQEFLQLGDKDRTQMLEEIFHLQRFDLVNKVAFLANQTEREITANDRVLMEIGEVAPEEISNMQTELEQCRRRAADLEADFQKMDARLHEMDSLRLKTEEYTAQQNEVAALSSREPEVRAMEQRLEDLQNCQKQFGGLLSKISEKKSAREELRLTQEQFATQCKELEEQQAHLKMRFAEVAKRHEEREIHLARATELDQIGKIAGMRKEAEEYRIKSQQLKERIAEKNEQLKSLEADQTRLREESDAAADQMERLNLLHHVQQWHIQNAHLNQQLTQLRQNLRSREQEHSERISELRSLYENLENRVDDLPALENFTPDLITDLIEKRAKHLDAMTAEMNRLSAQAHLAEQAHLLEPGKPCPLCGSTEHPAPLRDSDISQQAEELRLRLDHGREQQKALEHAEIRMKEIIKQRGNLESQIEEATRQVSQLEAQINDHLDRFLWEDFRGESSESIDKKIAYIQTLQETLKTAKARQQGISARIEKNRAEHHTLQEELLNVEKEVGGHTRSIEYMIDSLKYFTDEDAARLTTARAEEMARTIRTECDETERQYQQLKSELEKLEKDVISLNTKIEQKREDQQKLEQDLNRLQADLQENIRNSAYPDLAAIETILGQPIDEQECRREIQAFDRKLHEARTHLKRLEDEIGDRSFDPEAFAHLKAEIKQNRDQYTQATQRIAVLERELDQAAQKLRRREELEKELHRLHLRRENLGVLRNLFVGKGFVQYASRLYLRNLCDAANQRFSKLTRRRLQLEIGASNEILVRDLLNNGQTRSIKTLSGGQMFQAALCLALALADTVQARAGADHSFFFLDEGFGTLDRESLHEVFNALKTLRRERRIVGVISHVEELQQEMDVYLKIHHDEENGSKIVPSWQNIAREVQP